MQSKFNNQKINSSILRNSQQLRKNMTKEEKHLWYDFLKKIPITVNRQKIIGKYIVDFYIDSCKLVIELDGSQHYEEIHRENDKKRDEYLTRMGLTVLRFSNLDINRNFKAVCREISQAINFEYYEY